MSIVSTQGITESKAHEHQQRNMLAGIIHGTFFNMAQAFAEPFALLPIFLSGFTSSKLAIGLIVGVMQAAAVLPQLPISRFLRRRPHTAKPLMLIGIWTRCGVWGLLGFLAVTSSQKSVSLLWATIILISTYSFAGGIANLPFNRIISETIMPDKRSSFFGWRLFFGGFMAMAAGFVVKYVLGSNKLIWPKNFGVLFLLSFATLIIAYTAMSLLRFPNEPAGESKITDSSIWQECLHVFKVYPVMKKLVLIELLTYNMALVMPFLTLFATQDRNIPLKYVGIFIICIKLGAMLSNLLWMPIGNKVGTRILIHIGISMAIVSLLLMIFANSVFIFSLAFVITGLASSALMVGYNGYILEIGPEETRVLLVAIKSTMLLPLYFMPMLGGFIADKMGYQSLLLLGLLIFSLVLFPALSLCEPRRGDKACGPCLGNELT
jgi:MFS family permease